MRRVLALLALAVGSVWGSGAHDDFEWAGIFDVSSETSVHWVAQKKNHAYADATMEIVIVKVNDHEESDLEGAETPAETLFDGNSKPTKTVADTLDGTSTSGKIYTLQFDTTAYQSVFDIDVTSTDYIAIFAQHLPSEFEANTHYLLATDGDSLEPFHTLPDSHAPAAAPKDDHHDDKPWAEVLLTTFLVNLATLSGVAFLGIGMNPSKISASAKGAMAGFAGGALLGCALFLIMTESYHQVNGHWKGESAATWRWAAAVLGGFLTPLFLFVLEPSRLWKVSEIPTRDEAKKKSAGKVEEGQVDVHVAEDANDKTTTVFAVCIGDFFHNFTDGFAIAVAFKLCDHSLAWGIFGATIYHEVAQELADFVLLTTDVGCTVFQALIFNFVAGTSVIIGGMIATAVDVDDHVLGLILAYGGGTYIYLSCSKALPYALKLSNELETDFGGIKKHYALVLFFFILGAAIVALILFNHEHCDAAHDGHGAAEADPHAGHGHRI